MRKRPLEDNIHLNNFLAASPGGTSGKRLMDVVEGSKGDDFTCTSTSAAEHSINPNYWRNNSTSFAASFDSAITI